MHSENVFNNGEFHNSSGVQGHSTTIGLAVSHKTVIGFILVTALVAFEIFNFDTTRYALKDLLGDVNFWGLGWATILAIAFCAIDFAGLARLFTPERGSEEHKAVWYLMGAWLLGATMNAIMTWWAVSLTLLSHEFGNEVLSRQQLLQVVPIFVAALVWLTRILFIGAFSVAGEHIFDLAGDNVRAQTAQQLQPGAAIHLARHAATATSSSEQSGPVRSRPQQPQSVHRRPSPGSGVRRVPVGMQARSQRR